MSVDIRSARILGARHNRREALRTYQEKLDEFAVELEALKAGSIPVRIKGHPSTAATKFTDSESGEVSVVVAACSPLRAPEGGHKPWEKTGLIVDVVRKTDDLEIGLEPFDEGRIINFPVNGLYELEAVGVEE